MLRKIVSNTIDRLAAGGRARRLVSAGRPWPATPAAGPLARADIPPPMLSSLPWRSGASDGGFPCLSDLRHRTLDAINVFIAPPSFAQMVQNTGSRLQLSA